MSKEEALKHMQDLYPAICSEWVYDQSRLPVEMREIEHSLCEFDKYERVRLGEGKPRARYRLGEQQW